MGGSLSVTNGLRINRVMSVSEAGVKIASQSSQNILQIYGKEMSEKGSVFDIHVSNSNGSMLRAINNG